MTFEEFEDFLIKEKMEVCGQEMIANNNGIKELTIFVRPKDFNQQIEINGSINFDSNQNLTGCLGATRNASDKKTVIV